MMGLGMIDNCCLSYITLVLGFEFESKITPFGTKNFLEGLSVFAVLCGISIFGVNNQM